jgi:DNA-binding transcriptional LysR family regulator
VELRHLRYFVSVAEVASVSKAALRVHVSQPALSRQIHDLERELGVRLFDRVGRGIRLTAEGEDLLARARDVLTRADSLSVRA